MEMSLTKEDLQIGCDEQKHQLKRLQDELKAKNDQLSEFKNQMTSVKERELYYLHEIDMLQSCSKPKLHEKIKHLQEEFSQLYESLNSESLKQDAELNRLQNEMKVFSETTNSDIEVDDHSGFDSIFDNNVMLEQKVEVLNEDLCERELQFEQLQKQNSDLSESINNVHLELEQTKENIECKKQELVEAYNVMNTLQEDFALTKNEVESLKSKTGQVTDNENSLFAEVNDRRLKLQGMLLNLKNKCSHMKKEIASKQRQIIAQRVHNYELTKIIKDDPVECQQDYNILLKTYASRLSTLETLCEEYKNFNSERRRLFEEGLPDNTVQFLNNVIEQKRESDQKVNDAIGTEFRTQKMMSLQLKDVIAKVEEWKMTAQQLKVKMISYSDTIHQLQQQAMSDSNQKSLRDSPTTAPVLSNSGTKMNTFPFPDDKIIVATSISEGKGEDEIIAEQDKENVSKQTNAVDTKVKSNEKKVTFTKETVDTELSNKPMVRRGAKVIQCKSVHIPSLIKKK